MRPTRHTQQLGQIISALFMATTLLWLTVSAPFVFAAQQQVQVVAKADDAEDSANPFSGSTEEKTPASSNISEEFLHSHEVIFTCYKEKINPVLIHTSAPYTAFHGELLSPPPEA